MTDDILPEVPVRQWVVTFPHALRFLFATRPGVMGNIGGTNALFGMSAEYSQVIEQPST